MDRRIFCNSFLHSLVKSDALDQSEETFIDCESRKSSLFNLDRILVACSQSGAVIPEYKYVPLIGEEDILVVEHNGDKYDDKKKKGGQQKPGGFCHPEQREPDNTGGEGKDQEGQVEDDDGSFQDFLGDYRFAVVYRHG